MNVFLDIQKIEHWFIVYACNLSMLLDNTEFEPVRQSIRINDGLSIRPSQIWKIRL